MIRPTNQYIFSYNTQADKFCAKADTYISSVQKGVYLYNGGVLSLLLNYCKAAIELEITDTQTPNNVLDKIIVTL